MAVVTVSDKLRRVLEEITPGANLEAKLENLTRASLEPQLRTCNEALSHFEARYGLSFPEFARAWQEGKITNSHSHEVERNFMEWEAQHLEKEDILVAARECTQLEPGR